VVNAGLLDQVCLSACLVASVDGASTSVCNGSKTISAYSEATPAKSPSREKAPVCVALKKRANTDNVRRWLGHVAGYGIWRHTGDSALCQCGYHLRWRLRARLTTSDFRVFAISADTIWLQRLGAKSSILFLRDCRWLSTKSTIRRRQSNHLRVPRSSRLGDLDQRQRYNLASRRVRDLGFSTSVSHILDLPDPFLDL
jgi:hypothetical protein